MKAALINLCLVVTAIVLAIPFFPIGMVTTLWWALRYRKRVSIVTYLGRAAKSIALSIDTMGNVICADLLNLTMVRPNVDHYAFGTYTETISEVLGHNKARGTLSDAGRGLANLLNWIDQGHVERAAKQADHCPFGPA